MMKYQKTKIKCVETGQVFDSAAHAAHVAGCNRCTMANHLAGRTKHISGKHFVRVGEE